MEKKLHSLLLRQIRKSGLDLESSIEGKILIESISNTYFQFSKEVQILDSTTTKLIERMSKSNQNLQNIIESIDSFNYHVSHDLKTTIINNLSLTKMMQKYYQSKNREMAEGVIQRLTENSENGLRLIERYLEISKFEEEVSNTPVACFEVVKYVNDLCNELQFKELIKVQVHSDDFAHLEMDEISMHSIFQNFITNAYKYRKVREFPVLNIYLKSYEKHKVIEFSDNGIGIDLERNQKKIFKPFIRISKDDHEGTGVGLFIVKKLVTNMGGGIEVSSQLGKGTTFKVLLPK